MARPAFVSIVVSCLLVLVALDACGDADLGAREPAIESEGGDGDGDGSAGEADAATTSSDAVAKDDASDARPFLDGSADAEAGTAPPAVSCAGLAPTCGKTQNEGCCTSGFVPGGDYGRSNLVEYPTTVSSMWLDKFEITVGRFRAFVAAYPGNKPAAGDGANPHVAGSGWDPAWDDNLPVDAAALVAQLSCAGTGSNAWTDAPGGNENKAMSCATWFEMFAFCAWDGRRLPTEAEWNYAAAGGAEQRQYPWGGTAIDAAHAVYAPATAATIVGTHPLGDGKWGHADLAGNVMEWNLDFQVYPYPDVGIPCLDCAVLTTAPYRVVRGGGFGGIADVQQTYMRAAWGPMGRIGNLGARCVADP